MISLIRIQIVIAATGIIVACGNQTPSQNICSLDQQQLGQFIDVKGGIFIKSKYPIYASDGNPISATVEDFSILIHEVTNSEFAEFVSATGYITDAEKIHQATSTKGSAVFKTTNDDPGTSENVSTNKWSLNDAATWKTPNGVASGLVGYELLPVVHISNNDAAAYAKWTGGRLPTEIEWEYMARQGLSDPDTPTSGKIDKSGKFIANTWQGLFPILDKGDDGYKKLAPIACYPPSKLGLYDVIGNAWEWTSTSLGEGKHVVKGGSFLCADNYCRRYRPSTREVHETDFSTNHIGFRVVKDIR